MIRKRCKSCLDLYVISDEQMELLRTARIQPPKKCVKCRKLDILDDKLKSMRKMLARIEMHVVPRNAKPAK